MAVEETNAAHAEPAGFFAELERRSSALSPAVNTGFKRDRWLWLAIGVGMIVMLLPLGRMISGPLAGWLKVAAIVVEAACLGVLYYRQIRDIAPDFIDSKRKFAVEMDEHFAERNAVVAWIRRLPAVELAARLAYVDVRLDVLTSRGALVFGAVDRLGVLPVLVGLFLQLQALKSVSYPILLFGILIVALYCMALWLSRYRLLLENFKRLLLSAQDAPALTGPAE